jgi:hypothetical protein
MCIFEHPNSEVRFDGLSLADNPLLRFGIGVKEVVWNKIKSAITFSIDVIEKNGREIEIFSQTIDVTTKSVKPQWFDFEVDLRRYRKKAVSLTFKTSVPPMSDASYCWVGWSDPQLLHDKAQALPVVRSADRRNHIILITADALRADHLGCYGHPLVKTPNLDRLAADGVLLKHARAQTPLTLGSFASIMTGTHATKHGVVTEWGNCNPSVPNLPQLLKNAGYHTLVCVSEREHDEQEGGMVGWFDESIPCLADPGQSGDITVRAFMRSFDRRPDKPVFAWVQLFDTHPPSVSPEPFKSMYYQGDPTSPMKSYDPEKVQMIRAVESVLLLEPAIDLLQTQKVMDVSVSIRLLETADFLLGKRQTAPDLAHILQALGPVAMNGMPAQLFGAWLHNQLRDAYPGDGLQPLITWLKDVVPRLKEVESELVAWVKDVVDYRYPLAQYMSSVSYLDHVIGQLIDYLKQIGVYDQSTLVFTAPHGELLGEDELYFHHYALHENTIRVPAIMKLANSSGAARGKVIDGIFDHIDITPTLLNMLGLQTCPEMQGTSRLPEITNGTDIPEHDSFSLDFHETLASITRPPFIFIKALKPVYTWTSWHWQAGQTGLYKLKNPMTFNENLSRQLPDIADAMEERLSRWLQISKQQGEYQASAV